MFEGTGKYFLLLFLIFTIVYITKKICLYFLFRRAKEMPYKALIPIYSTKVLIEMLNMKKFIFYLCLIPGVNLFYYHQIYKELLLSFGQNGKEAILFDLIPMYKFPELVFKKPKFILDEDLTSEFFQNQNILFEKPEENGLDAIETVLSPQQNKNKKDSLIIEPVRYEQMPETNNFSNFYDRINDLEMGDIMNDENKVNDDIYLYKNNSNNVWDIEETPMEPQNLKQVEIEDNRTYTGDSVFTNKSLEPDERHETVIIAEKKVKKEKNPIDPYKDGRPQMCPNCGAKLASGATTCFLCGTKL